MATESDAGFLVNTFQSLKDHLAKLEREQKTIRAELARKRKDRAQRLQEIRETRTQNTSSLNRLDEGLKATLSQSRQQQKYLQAMRDVQKQNESALNRIAAQLDGMETMLNQRPVPVAQLKSELINMLRELEQIRERREKVERLF